MFHHLNILAVSWDAALSDPVILSQVKNYSAQEN
jgi:hypothetical protein